MNKLKVSRDYSETVLWKRNELLSLNQLQVLLQKRQIKTKGTLSTAFLLMIKTRKMK